MYMYIIITMISQKLLTINFSHQNQKKSSTSAKKTNKATSLGPVVSTTI